MKSSGPRTILELDQVREIRRRIDNKLTPTPELAVEYIKLGMISAEIADCDLHDIDLDVLNRIVNERRSQQYHEQAVELVLSYRARKRSRTFFLSNYLASIAGGLTIILLSGIITIALVVGNRDNLGHAAEMINAASKWYTQNSVEGSGNSTEENPEQFNPLERAGSGL